MSDDVGRMEELWAEGDFLSALKLGRELAERHPADAALRERLALMHIQYARHDPSDNQILKALHWLNEALTVEPDRVDALEVRGHLYTLVAHQAREMGEEAVPLFRHALADFLRLLEIAPAEEEARTVRWRLEGARSAFLVEKNLPRSEGNYRLSAALYGSVDADLLDVGDWFFRGMANLEIGQKDNDQQVLRIAAACFLRSVEEDAFVVEGRYFAADAFLSLEEPSDEEYNHAALLVRELEAMPSKDFLVDILKDRLEIRGKLLGRNPPESEEGKEQ